MSFTCNCLIQLTDSFKKEIRLDDNRFLSCICISYEQYNNIKPFFQYVKNYINESIDFLNKCDGNTGENATIVNFHNSTSDKGFNRSNREQNIKLGMKHP